MTLYIATQLNFTILMFFGLYIYIYIVNMKLYCSKLEII